MKADKAAQKEWKRFARKLRAREFARMQDGSGLQMSNLFRTYFHEFLNRFENVGPSGFPTSFNVVEAFLKFNADSFPFDLRAEREHLLSLDAYFDWYRSDDLPKETGVLQEVLLKGIIYSYDLVGGANSVRIPGDSEMVIAGVSFVRHQHELSCVLLGGENPPSVSDEAIEASGEREIPTIPGKEKIKADSSLSTKDRYLDGYPEFARILLLTRLDLRDGTHDVRYLNIDCGRGFKVLTDDRSPLTSVPGVDADAVVKQSISELTRYGDLFSALVSMIYLPAYFIAFSERVSAVNVATELGIRRQDSQVKKAVKCLGIEDCVFERNIDCIQTIPAVEPTQVVVQPPELEFKTEGFWRVIGTNEVGQGRNGENVIGKTWVTRHESWSTQSPKSFLICQTVEESEGPDPGWIYVQRCPSDSIDLYKIGLTRRKPADRARELSSSTSAPLPFDVISNWFVGDCQFVEKRAHEILEAFRINPKREFFRADLGRICRAIEEAIRELVKEDSFSLKGKGFDRQLENPASRLTHRMGSNSIHHSDSP